MAIVAVCVAVFVVFGLIASERKDRARLPGRGPHAAAGCSTSSAGRPPSRSPSALESEQGPAAARATRSSCQRGGRALRGGRTDDDPRVRRYLALALGRLARPARRARAAAGRRGPQRPTADARDASSIRSWALGAIGDPAAVPELSRLARAATTPACARRPCTRSARSTGRGARGAGGARSTTPRPTCAGTPALALARRGRRRPRRPCCVQMLDRAHLARAAGPHAGAARRRGAGGGARPRRRSRTRAAPRAASALRDGDPSLKVREAARVALAARVRHSAPRIE